MYCEWVSREQKIRELRSCFRGYALDHADDLRPHSMSLFRAALQDVESVRVSIARVQYNIDNFSQPHTSLKKEPLRCQTACPTTVPFLSIRFLASCIVEYKTTVRMHEQVESYAGEYYVIQYSRHEEREKERERGVSWTHIKRVDMFIMHARVTERGTVRDREGEKDASVPGGVDE